METTITNTGITEGHKYVDEEVESSYGYLSDYKPKSIVEQITVLRQLFPELGPVDEQIASGILPLNVEGWFAIPKWEKIFPTYGEAVQKVLDLIKQTRNGKFHNFLEGKLVLQYLRQSKASAIAFQKLGDEQKNSDILVVPVQFGLRHRGRSVRRALEVMDDSEFGLGAFAIGCMLLTHPKRLQYIDDLWIDCTDEFSLDADCDFSKTPNFRFNYDEVQFGMGFIGDVYGYCGLASGFLFSQ